MGDNANIRVNVSLIAVVMITSCVGIDPGEVDLRDLEAKSPSHVEVISYRWSYSAI